VVCEFGRLMEWAVHDRLGVTEMNQVVASDITLKMREFKLFQDLMYSHAGIALSDMKHALVQSRLKRRIRALGMTTYRAYYEYISDKKNADEFQECLNALTTNETYFFRHKNHWDFFCQEIVPDWKRNNRRGMTFRFWSAASSTGEEPYSAAIALYELLPPDSGYRIHVDATDINKDVLSRAAAGVYGEYSVQKMTDLCLKKYFNINGARTEFHVVDQVRRLVQFNSHNLQTPKYGEPYDVIFLRNVMIYFDESSKSTVLRNVTGCLKPGGYLFLGGAETLSACQEHYVYSRPTIYRKVEG